MNLHVIRFLGLAICLAVGSSASAQQLPSVVRGISVPDELAGFLKVSMRDFESSRPGLGYSFAYNAPGVKATVYIYDFGMKDLPDRVITAAVRDQGSMAMREIVSVYSQVRVSEPLLPAPEPCQGFLRAAVSYIEPHDTSSQPLHSHLLVAAVRGNFLKVRITYAASSSTQGGELSAERFSTALCQMVSR